jgi:hypothetical protein
MEAGRESRVRGEVAADTSDVVMLSEKWPPAPPTSEEMQQFFSVAEKYEFWLASPDENAAIGISLR